MNYIPKSTEVQESLDKVREQLALATKYVDTNKECFIALWMLQNPEANLNDYTVCYQHDWTDSGHTRMWMEKKHA